MTTLRDYQADAIQAIRASYRSGCRAPLLVSPTGSGKTVMFAYIAQQTAAKGNRAMILVHRQELVDQSSATLRAFGVPHGIIAAGRSPDPTHQIQLGMIQTVARRSYQAPDLIVIDEAHHGTAGAWRKVIEANPQAKILGVTATPERLDGKGLGEVFDDLVHGPEVAWLIDNGFLSNPRYYAPPQVADMSSLHTRAGDFAKEELNAAMDTPSITGDAVDHYRRICPGVPAVAFCVSIRHAEHVAEQFRAAGFQAATIDGTLERNERRERVKMLGDGRLHVLTSCEIINEGFDLPVVGAAILLRPTQSLGLHLQQIGRVLRPAPGKAEAVILDHVGTLARHGFAEDTREWSLGGRKKRKGSGVVQTVDVRQCSSCYACHHPAPTCPECGFVYPVKERKIEEVDGELQEIKAAERKEARKAQGRAQTLEELVDLGRSRGYPNPYFWARRVMEGRKR
jgi:superfamily II DNA or RNA helicase